MGSDDDVAAIFELSALSLSLSSLLISLSNELMGELLGVDKDHALVRASFTQF